MEIQIPSIENQNKCVENIIYRENVINRWEKDIEYLEDNNIDNFLMLL